MIKKLKDYYKACHIGQLAFLFFLSSPRLLPSFSFLLAFSFLGILSSYTISWLQDNTLMSIMFLIFLLITICQICLLSLSSLLFAGLNLIKHCDPGCWWLTISKSLYFIIICICKISFNALMQRKVRCTTQSPLFSPRSSFPQLLSVGCWWLTDASLSESHRDCLAQVCAPITLMTSNAEAQRPIPLAIFRKTLKGPLGWGLCYLYIIVPLLPAHLAFSVPSEVLLLGTLLNKTTACKSLT